MIELSQKQQQILDHYREKRPKILILEGAVRSGKTFLNNILFYEELKNPFRTGLHYIITGHTIGSIKRNIVEPMGEMFKIDCKLDNHGTFSLWGNKVHCFGADRADSYQAMTGMTAHGWYANEITLQHENTIMEAFNRISGEDAIVLWDTNPDYPEHPIKLNFINHSGDLLSSGKIRIQSWHFELWDNNFLEEEYVENLKATIPQGMWFDRRVKGLWVSAEGLVWETWHPDIHVIEPFKIPSDWTRIRGIDWGYENPFICLWAAIDHDDRLYIYDEHYKNHMLIRDHAAQIKKRKWWIENTETEEKREGRYSWTIADHDPQDAAEIRQHGINTIRANKDVAIGLQKVAARLEKQKDGKPRLFVFNNCINTRREMGLYRWADRKADKPVKEEPLKLNDHCPDTIRYMVMKLDGTHKIKVSEVSASKLGL